MLNENRLDRLYNLLPVIYRLRDAEQGYPLRGFLQIISEQVNVVEDDIQQLYENWFIETSQDWAVPYIGDLVGYQLVHEAGEPGDVQTVQSRARNKILIPRRDVANTIRNRRRKGTLALLELIAQDVAGWPARAVEFYKLLGWTQSLNHLHVYRGCTANLRNLDILTQIEGPFDACAHTVDVRRIDSGLVPGRYNIPSVGLFVWRLKPYTVTKTIAKCIEEVGSHCYTFSILGNDMQLFVRAQLEPVPTHIADEMNLPVAIRRWAFDSHKEDYYGAGKSFVIWAPGWSKKYDSTKPLPLTAIVPADLSDWSYRPMPDHVAVDPVRGRMVFPPEQSPSENVYVSYVYAFSMDIGGGEYDRPLSQPGAFSIVRVGIGEATKSLHDAWNQIKNKWKEFESRAEATGDVSSSKREQAQRGVIEIVDNGVYTDQLVVELKSNQSLQIRAANRARPVLRLLDRETGKPDALMFTLEPGSHLTLDGLLITGRSVAIHAHESKVKSDDDECPADVTIRHCTFVPGWSMDCDCEPKHPTKPSLELHKVYARLRIEHSIIGSIQVNENQVQSEPIPITITDSILDGLIAEANVLSAPGQRTAHAILTIARCTVFGQVLVHAIKLAENCIFNSCLSVARRQLGCIRFCYISDDCRTPRRYHCQPDLVVTVMQTESDKQRERDHVCPRFNSRRYGRFDYAQLADQCAEEIKRGADDESEIGVFHDLFNPQREANLRVRLEEYMPAGMEAGIIFVNYVTEVTK